MDRRTFLKFTGATGAGVLMPPTFAATGSHQRVIPASGESLPAVGMGTWLTFQVGNDAAELAVRERILRTFLDRGGMVVDSSPMYGRAEAVIGHCMQQIDRPGALFSATKVWMLGQRFGIRQMEHSESLWGGDGFDLMQVHNLLDWDSHLETLAGWKAPGRIRYTGLTTSHGRRHHEMARLIRAQPVDFVQFTYNVADRGAEQRLLPLCADQGKAVIINRPFQGGRLFDYVRGKPLPPWAVAIDCANWAQFFLKFIISHPAVTCAIPATSQVMHMEENMGALYGRLPDTAMRRRMVEYFEASAG